MKRKLLVLMTTVAVCGAVAVGCTKEAADQKAETNTETAQNEITVDTESEATTDESAEIEATEQESSTAALEDGIYQVDFETDSGMFHVNEACEGKGKLTVEDGKMTVHISLVSKKILNLYQGLAEDAQKEGAELLQPTTDTVTYSDGTSEDVYGFDVPVPVLGEEFDLALVGEKGTWYDHKVSVSNPELEQ